LSTQIIVHEWIVEEWLTFGVVVHDETANKFRLIRNVRTNKSSGESNLTISVYVYCGTLALDVIGKCEHDLDTEKVLVE
jgi:hypothetical protein